jgi:hypothetical protein
MTDPRTPATGMLMAYAPGWSEVTETVAPNAMLASRQGPRSTTSRADEDAGPADSGFIAWGK